MGTLRKHETWAHITSALFISVDDKTTSDVLVVFVIKKSVTSFETVLCFLLATVAIFKCTMFGPGWDLSVSNLYTPVVYVIYLKTSNIMLRVILILSCIQLNLPKVFKKFGSKLRPESE